MNYVNIRLREDRRFGVILQQTVCIFIQTRNFICSMQAKSISTAESFTHKGQQCRCLISKQEKTLLKYD